MKKLFLSVMLVAFAVAVNAGEGKDGKSCCPSKASAEAKAVCPVTGKQVKAQCTAGDKQVKVAKVNSPKGAEQAKR